MDLTRALQILGKKKKEPVAPIVKQHVNTAVLTCPYCDFEHPEAPLQSCIIGCGNCLQPFEAIVTNTATGKRVQGEKQSRDHLEYIKTYSTKPVKVTIIEKKEVPDITTLEEATEQYNAGHLSIEDFRDLCAKHDDWGYWDIDNGRNPFHPEGDTKSREMGMTYHPRRHPKGIFYQQVIKMGIYRFIDFGYGATRALYGKDKAGRLKRWALRRMLHLAPGFIEYANSAMKTQYDKDAFEFSDPFLLALRNTAREHINKNFQWDYGRVEQLMLKGTDLALANLREDMPYRAKAKLFFNDIIKKYPNGFELTSAEQQCQDISNQVAEKCKREGGPSTFKMPTFTPAKKKQEEVK